MFSVEIRCKLLLQPIKIMLKIMNKLVANGISCPCLLMRHIHVFRIERSSLSMRIIHDFQNNNTQITDLYQNYDTQFDFLYFSYFICLSKITVIKLIFTVWTH